MHSPIKSSPTPDIALRVLNVLSLSLSISALWVFFKTDHGGIEWGYADIFLAVAGYAQLILIILIISVLLTHAGNHIGTQTKARLCKADAVIVLLALCGIVFQYYFIGRLH